jgi:lysyl-tRNA synthetase class 2
MPTCFWDRTLGVATTRSETSLRERRIEKLELLERRGREGYPRRFRATHSSAEAARCLESDQQTPVTVAGRIMALREHGRAVFADLHDRSGKIQLYLKHDVLGDELFGLCGCLDIGDLIGARGEVFRTRRGEPTVLTRQWEMLAKCLRPLPEKWHGLRDQERRYRQRYLDLLVNADVRRVAVARSALVRQIRSFLDERGFMEVETPVLQPLYGGGSAQPFVTHHQSLRASLYLRIADELYLKRLLVGGFERVYEIGKDFRNEGLDRLHNPEFTQLELYQAYADYRDMMGLFEALVMHLAVGLNGSPRLVYQGLELDLSAPWPRVTYGEVLKRWARVSMDAPEAVLRERLRDGGIDDEALRERGSLLEKLFDRFVQPELRAPVFVIDYPTAVSPLAKSSEDNPSVVERFEPFAVGMELGNAFTELNDPREQRRRFEHQVRLREGGELEAQPLDEDFIEALEYGMPPTGGMGVGIDRLSMLLLDQPSIRDVILFPQLRAQGEVAGGE